MFCVNKFQWYAYLSTETHPYHCGNYSVITRLLKQKHKATKVLLLFCLTLDLPISEFIQKWVNILPQCNVDVY